MIINSVFSRNQAHAIELIVGSLTVEDSVFFANNASLRPLSEYAPDDNGGALCLLLQ